MRVHAAVVQGPVDFDLALNDLGRRKFRELQQLDSHGYRGWIDHRYVASSDVGERNSGDVECRGAAVIPDEADGGAHEESKDDCCLRLHSATNNGSFGYRRVALNLFVCTMRGLPW